LWAARIYLKLHRYQDASRLLDTTLNDPPPSQTRNCFAVRDFSLIALTIADQSPHPSEEDRAILHRVVRFADTVTNCSG
jgi:hypothetical protein